MNPDCFGLLHDPEHGLCKACGMKAECVGKTALSRLNMVNVIYALPPFMPCHHTWFQKEKDVVSVVNGLETTKYTHECPQCGKVKVTVRASRKLPPAIKWKRELEKLLERAALEGCLFEFNNATIDIKGITVNERKANT